MFVQVNTNIRISKPNLGSLSAVLRHHKENKCWRHSHQSFYKSRVKPLYVTLGTLPTLVTGLWQTALESLLHEASVTHGCSELAASKVKVLEDCSRGMT